MGTADVKVLDGGVYENELTIGTAAAATVAGLFLSKGLIRSWEIGGGGR